MLFKGGERYSFADEQDIKDFLVAYAFPIFAGDDTATLTQRDSETLVLTADTFGEIEFDLTDTESNEVIINLGAGVDTLRVDSDIDLGDRALFLTADDLTVSDGFSINTSSDINLSGVAPFGYRPAGSNGYTAYFLYHQCGRR